MPITVSVLGLLMELRAIWFPVDGLYIDFCYFSFYSSFLLFFFFICFDECMIFYLLWS